MARTVRTLDLAGHGLSSRPDASYALAWHAHIIATWFARLGLEHYEKYVCADYPDLSAILRAFIASLPGVTVHEAGHQFWYGIVANNDISFQVGVGELVGIIGPNGAGKSTLFDLLTGFQTADAGEVLLDGHPIARLRPDEISRLGQAFAAMTAALDESAGSQRRKSPGRSAAELDRHTATRIAGRKRSFIGPCLML